MKTFIEAENYLNSLVTEKNARFPGEIGLKRMRLLLERLENPKDFFQTVHVAGTSGKGSTSSMIAKILQEAGYKTGLHISPHVVSIKERMQVNSLFIGDNEFVDLVSELKSHIEHVSRLKYGQVTFFEAVVALSFEYFKRNEVDIAVIETGLGGTFDGTNVIQSLISVITPISYDHTEVLGKTLSEISENKAGIIKETNRAVISAAQPEEAEKILEKKAREKGTILITEKKHFYTEVLSENEQKIIFDYIIKEQEKNIMALSLVNKDRISNISCSLLGAHQAQNAGLAITAALELKDAGYEIKETHIKNALRNVFIPGRLEILKYKRKNLILDGAHNEEKMKALTTSLSHIWKDKKFTVIFACKKKKDIAAMACYLNPHINKLIITKFTGISDLGRDLGMKENTIQNAFIKNDYKGKILIKDTPEKALQEALKYQEDVLVTGSLFLVSEIRALLYSK